MSIRLEGDDRIDGDVCVCLLIRCMIWKMGIACGQFGFRRSFISAVQSFLFRASTSVLAPRGLSFCPPYDTPLRNRGNHGRRCILLVRPFDIQWWSKAHV
jgi:hypothetical protein